MNTKYMLPLALLPFAGSIQGQKTAKQPAHPNIILFMVDDMGWEDIGEKNNVAASHPDIVRRLSKDLGDYLRKVDAQRPAIKATGQPCSWPDER